MDYLVDGSELVFLYQLVRGKAKSSRAFDVANSTELDQDLVRRAAEVRTVTCALPFTVKRELKHLPSHVTLLGCQSVQMQWTSG